MKKNNLSAIVLLPAMILSLALWPLGASAQDMMGKTGLVKLWDGLKMRQPDTEMPKGKAPFKAPMPKVKYAAKTKLIPTSIQGEYIISDGWELGTSDQVMESETSIFNPSFDTQDWYNATVPGTILTTLVDQGVYPDPYFGLNNLSIPDTLSRTDWWYRTKFELPDDVKDQRIRMMFDGINYQAQIFLNGKKLGNITGAFIRGEYDVTKLINKSGENILAVLIRPPFNPGIPHEQSMIAGQGLNGGQLSLDGPTFTASVGWDWIPGIRDRDSGIWQDVKLKIGGGVKIGDPQVITNIALPDTSKATVTIVTPIQNLTDKAVSGTISANFEGVSLSMSYALSAGETKTIVFSPDQYKELNIKNPRLWWPNGYGLPNLYHLELETRVGTEFSDQKKLRFGIRELSYELMINTPEKGNHRVAYTPVDANNNNQPIFDYENVVLVGDPQQKRAIPTLYKDIVESQIFDELPIDDPAGQYLVFRVNGVRIFIKGGTFGMDDAMKRVSRERLVPYFELHKDANFNLIRNWVGQSTEELFYELADEYGMLVWNDFWITTDDTVEPNDYDLFVANATDVVRRYRTHPSIALWCPRNEGYAPEGMEPILASMMAKEDPTRHYHGNSRFLNAINSGPYGYIKDRKRYYSEWSEGFNTEFGAQAIPTANTIRKFIPADDLWPINDVWAYHDLHHTTHFFEDFMEAVNSYGKASSMEEFSKKAQMVTYDTWRAIVESWNSRMWNNTTGLILWMSHPAWPSMTWQTYTYDYETPGSYFGTKKAQEPLHVQMNLNNDMVVIVNSTRNNFKNMKLEVRCFDLLGNEYYSREGRYDVHQNSKLECFIPQLEDGGIQKYTLVRLQLKDGKGNLVSVNDYWKNWDKIESNAAINGLGKPLLKSQWLKDKTKGETKRFEIENTSQNIAVAVKLNVVASETGEIVLPAYFSDGYFNLISGEKRIIELRMPENAPLDIKIVAEGYNFDQTTLL